VSRQLAKYAKDEYQDYVIYKALAAMETDLRRKQVLEKLSQKEYEHYLFWRSLCGYEPAGPPKVKKILLTLLRRLMGVIFVVKLLELHERSVIKWYKQLYSGLSHKDREILSHIIEEEESHERALLDQIEESAINYIGFIALGLSDAIIEITGVHAGFLGATNMTLIAGVAGLTVGFAASISMAAASYLQARQTRVFNPLKAAAITGVTYMVTVIFLALPYFVTRETAVAFTASLLVSILMISAFTFYGGVVRDMPLKREITIGIVLTLGTAGATFLFGEWIAGITNIRALIGG
jgi:VIT1/CCC1 family predicted Fe2+/Mn2+ transporter